MASKRNNGKGGSKSKSRSRPRKKKKDIPSRATLGDSEEKKTSSGSAAGLSSLFVDEIPRLKIQNDSGEKKDLRPRRKSERAAERRRLREKDDADFEGPSTKTSLPPKERESLQQQKSKMSEDMSLVVGRLTCIEGPEIGVTLDLKDGSFTIGRGRENKLILKDLAASRTHVRINVQDGDCIVRDLKSGNGTRLNQQSIQKAKLKDGDVLEVGNSILLYTDLEANASNRQSTAFVSTSSSGQNQRRIAVVAEKLAAELAERFHKEQEEYGEISDPAKSMQISDGSELELHHSFVDDSEMARAIDEMIHQVSDGEVPSLTNETGNSLWADSETETQHARLSSGRRKSQGLGGAGLPAADARAQGGYSDAPGEGLPRGEYAGTSRVPPRISVRPLFLVCFLLVVAGGGGWFLWGEPVDFSSVPDPQMGEERRAKDTMPSNSTRGGPVEAKKTGKPTTGEKTPAQATSGKEAATKVDKPAVEDNQMAADPGSPADQRAAKESTPSKKEEVKKTSSQKRIKPKTSRAKAKKRKTKKKIRSQARTKKTQRRAPAKTAPKTKSRKVVGSSALTDSQAKNEMRKAVKYLKQDDYDKACSTLSKIISQAKSSSLWRTKAQNLLTRRCQ